MAAVIITRAELQEYSDRAGVVGFSDTQFDQAIIRATDKIRQAMLNDYTPASFELLDSSTAPGELRDTAFSLGLGILTKGDAGRPASIDTEYVAASQSLGYIVNGRTHYDESPGAVLEKRSSGSGSTVSHRRRTGGNATFDRDNDSQDFNLRFPKI